MVLLASGVQEQLQVASPKVREKGRGRVRRKWAQTGCMETGGGGPERVRRHTIPVERVLGGSIVVVVVTIGR
jgi:hypothetical protein